MPKPAHGYDKPLTEKGELSERGTAKLQAQVKKAESLMRTAERYSKSWYTAKRMRDRAKKLLGPTSSPGKKPSQEAGDKYAKRREPIEKATGTKHIKAALVGVAKRAQEADER